MYVLHVVGDVLALLFLLQRTKTGAVAVRARRAFVVLLVRMRVCDRGGACAHPSPPLAACVQVQLLYDLAAQNSRGRRARGSSHEGEGVAALGTQATQLSASEDTTRALTRLAEQASAKMSLAASKTEFKEAALWRDRRDALLCTIQLLEPKPERETALA